MELKDKYAPLVEIAKQGNVENLQVRDENGVLYINGTSPTAELKNRLWASFGEIDPDFRAGDLVMDIDVASGAGSQAKVITKESNLNIRKGPGTDQPVVGKAAHGATVSILGKANDQWALIKNEGGIEGYVYNQYLEIL